MQHLNYCRQILSTAFDVYQPAFKGFAPGDFKRIIERSKKFVLPKNGVIFSDIECRGIDIEMPLAMPFSTIALEFEVDDGKTVLFVTNAFDGMITIFPAIGGARGWCFLPMGHIGVDGCVRRRGTDFQFLYTYDIENSFVGAKGHDNMGASFQILLGLLNALACKNVHIEKSPAKSTKQGKKVKAALPFDDYHFLTVDVPGKTGVRGEGLGGSHRSPREHLRRGHIRRLDSGPIWVNACVVNAGIGSKVGKSYLVRRNPQ